MHDQHGRLTADLSSSGREFEDRNGEVSPPGAFTMPPLNCPRRALSEIISTLGRAPS